MKKNLFKSVKSYLLTTLLIGVLAPAMGQDLSLAYHKVSAFDKGSSVTAPATGPVSTKVLRSFEQSFGGAERTTWYTGPKNLVAELILGDRRAVASFTKKGQRVYTILYGSAQHLPAAQQQIVESFYCGYDVTATQQIIMEGKETWIVNLRNNTSVIKVGIENGALHELERLQSK